MRTNIKIPPKRLLLICFVIVVLSFLGIKAIPSIFEFVEVKTLDLRFRIRETIDKHPQTSALVYNLSIDDYSLDKSKSYFWNKAILVGGQ